MRDSNGGFFGGAVRCWLAIAACALLPIPAAAVDCQYSVLNHDERPLDGGAALNLCRQYRGKVVLVVNTASHSPDVGQLRELQALYRRFKAQGLVVLGFPSDDFHHEIADPAQIARVSRQRYGVGFPMFRPVHVAGTRADGLYRDLYHAVGAAPSKDFIKYLIDRDGQVVGYFDALVTPRDSAFLESVKAQLQRSAH